MVIFGYKGVGEIEVIGDRSEKESIIVTGGTNRVFFLATLISFIQVLHSYFHFSSSANSNMHTKTDKKILYIPDLV